MTPDTYPLIDSFVELFGSDRRLQAAVLIATALVVGKLTDWGITRWVLRWTAKTRTQLDDRLVRLLHRPIFWTVVVIGLWLASSRLGLEPETLRRTLRLLRTVTIVIWLVFGLRAGGLVLDALSRRERRASIVEPRTLTLFDNVFRVVLVGAGVYFLFLTWGIDVGALVASLGIAGIAVGFAAKDTLANLFAGIFILADAPYKVGDFIVLDGGERGRVTHIGLRSSRLLTRDDIEIIIPNAVIASSKVINESGGRWEKERIRIGVSVAYGSDIDHVEALLLEIASGHDELCREPEPRVRFRSFGASGLELELLAWVDEPVLRGRMVHELNREIYKRFRVEGIEIPYPKRDVYLHRGEGETPE